MILMPAQPVVYRGTITGLRISAVDGTAFLDALDQLYTERTISGLTCNLSMVDGTAFITNPSVDLTPYIGRKITLTAGGKTLVGWIKAAGSGETLDDDKYSDPSFSNPINWTIGNPWWAVSSGATGTNANDASMATGLYKSINFTAGQLMKCSWICTACSSDMYLIQAFGHLTYSSGWITSVGSFSVYKTSLYTLPFDTGIRGDNGLFNGSFSYLSLRQVLTPSATGVVIQASQSDTTENWTSNDGIDPNAASFTATIECNPLTFADGNHKIEIYDSAGSMINGVAKAVGTVESLDSEVATGTLTALKLYKITATEEDHFGVGLVVGSYFTSAGTETCDANNKVRCVLAGGTSASTIVSAKGGETYSFAYQQAGFVFSAASYYCVVKKIR